MAHLARQERQALCDTFAETGPDAPTLCDPWRTRDLAAHLVIRERRPDVALGAAIPQLPVIGARAKRVQDEYADWEWPLLVDLVRSGAPRWMPMSVGVVDEAVNTAEYFVHHEDVLRAEDPGASVEAADADAGGTGPTPRPHRQLDPALESALWTSLTRMGRVFYRSAPVGVVLVTPDHGRRQVRPPREAGSVVLRGTPGELLLHAFGRGRVADVEVEGDPEAVQALAATRLGF